MAAKSEGRVSRADLHAHPQLMTVPPEVQPLRRHPVYKLAAAIGTFGAMFWVLVIPMD